MNPMIVSLEVLLAVLLLATLFFGLRLEAKLKVLRQSQAGFASAVRDLDGAAQRAESGLDALRIASDEARSVLLQRMDAAQAMALRLEELTTEAESAALRADAAAANALQAAAPRPPMERPSDRNFDLPPVPPSHAYSRPASRLAAGPPEAPPPAGSRLREAAALLRGGR
jgi:hypothetical protein